MKKRYLNSQNKVVEALQAQHGGTLLKTTQVFVAGDWIVTDNEEEFVVKEAEFKDEFTPIVQDKNEKQGTQMDWSSILKNPDKFYEGLAKEGKKGRRSI